MRRRFYVLLTELIILMSCVLTGCTTRFVQTAAPAPASEAPAVVPGPTDTPIPTLSLTRTPKKDKEPIIETKETEKDEVSEDGKYYDLENVVLYYEKFGKLPSNYMTKKEAKGLGWEGGKTDDYVKDSAIGGDHFGNYEKLLPAGKGISYIECDIDTHHKGRGAKRLIISNKGDYYYTEDHYESFVKVEVRDGKVFY